MPWCLTNPWHTFFSQVWGPISLPESSLPLTSGRKTSALRATERFHLPKNSRNSAWDVNGTRRFGSFHWKFSGINGIPEKAVPFSRWKLPNFCSRLYHQFHTFRGLLNGQASLPTAKLTIQHAPHEGFFPFSFYPVCHIIAIKHACRRIDHAVVSKCTNYFTW